MKNVAILALCTALCGVFSLQASASMPDVVCGSHSMYITDEGNRAVIDGVDYLIEYKQGVASEVYASQPYRSKSLNKEAVITVRFDVKMMILFVEGDKSESTCYSAK